MLKDTWKTIRDAIDGDIRAGVFAPGDQLPTEPELAKRFGAGRHSVRRAVAELAVAGKLRVEQGRGTFVEDAPRLTYTIGKRTRLRDNLTSQGVDVSREFLSADMVDAGAGVAEALRIGAADKVIRSTFLTSADGMPIAFGSSFHAAARFPDYIARRNVFGSVTETYRSFGITDYLRGETTISSRRARGDEAKLLRQHPDQPVMVIRAVDTEPDGTPIGCSQVVWSSTRVEFRFANSEAQTHVVL